MTRPSETTISLSADTTLNCPAHPADCLYVRLVRDGQELFYWDSQEWGEDPVFVMGAIMGALASAQKRTAKQDGQCLLMLQRKEYKVLHAVLLNGGHKKAALLLFNAVSAAETDAHLQCDFEVWFKSLSTVKLREIMTRFGNYWDDLAFMNRIDEIDSAAVFLARTRLKEFKT